MTDKKTATAKTQSRPVDSSIWRVDSPAPTTPEQRAKGAKATPQPPSAPSSPTVVAQPPKAPAAEPTVVVPTATAVGAAAAVETVRKKGHRTRKARLRLSRIDPWSVMKTVFLFAIAFGVMFWVATYLVWTVLDSSGLFPAVNKMVTDLISSPASTAEWRIEDYVSQNKVLGISALISVVNVVLMTALGTIAAFLYNLSANILGGLEVTLAED